MISIHPASQTIDHTGSSIENGITVGFVVDDVKSALDELRTKGIRIYRDIVEREREKYQSWIQMIILFLCLNLYHNTKRSKLEGIMVSLRNN
ncbi:MAG: VOC family protein [Nitrosopumilus sp.]